MPCNGYKKEVGLSFVKFEVPQRQQLASERTSLSLFAPAPSTISFVPLTRNLSPANPTPSEGGQASQMQLPLASTYPSIAQRAPCSNRQTGHRVSVREIRYRKQASTVRNSHSVLKKASWGTRRIFGSIRCKKQAFPVRKRYSVRRTAFSGTRRIFKGPQNSRLHRLWAASCRTGRIFRGVPCQKQPPAAPDASSVRETAPARRLADIKRG